MAGKKIRKKPGTNRTSFRIIIILIAGGVLIAGYWLYSCLYCTDPQFNFLVISRNGNPMQVLNGETLRLHPMDRVKILSISTSICFNQGIRLVSNIMDINSLRYEESSLVELLPEREPLDRYSFKVEVKRNALAAGYINLVIEPYVEDWIDRVNRTIKNEKKVELLERALDLGFVDEKIIQRLINEYITLEMWDKAAARLDEIAKTSPDEETYSRLLRVYEAMKMTDKVISVLKDLIKMAPEKTNYVIQLAETLENSGRIKEAIREYEGLEGRIPEEALVPVYKKLGFLCAENRQPDKAINYYLKALKTDPDDVNLYYNLSALYEGKKQYEKANQYLAEALKRQTGDLDSRLKLADSLIKRKDFKTAEKYLKEVLNKRPDSIDAWLLMANLEDKRGNKKGLMSAYKKIISLDSKNLNAVYNLGVLEYEAGNLDSALTYFEKYVKSYSKDINTRGFLFDIYRKKKKNDLAYKEALKIVELKPGEKGYYPFIFEQQDKAGNYKSMVKVMEAAVKNNPDDINIRRYLIVGYLKTGNDKQAVTQIEEILKKGPDDVPLLMQLAQLQEKIGNPEKALEIYKKVLEVSPGNEAAEEAYLRVRLSILSGG